MIGAVAFALLSGCNRGQLPERKVQIDQDWVLQAGSEVAGYAISSGLGDITLELGGDVVRMPFDGEVQPAEGGCVMVSSPEVPAYLFRLCGVHNPKLGARSQHQTIGHAQQLVFATLRKQPSGTWAMVEPSTSLIKQLVRE
ncbi:MAG: hypothetical protein AAGF01_12595 [Cyanobacteria bacterium P01_G01_bin.38]